MGIIRTWGIALCTAALLSGLLQTAAGEGIARRGLRFAVGLFLVLSIVSPFRSLSIEDIDLSIPEVSLESLNPKQDEETLLLLRQTEASLRRSIDDALQDVGVQAESILVRINTDDAGCIYLEQVDILLPPAYLSRSEEITATMYTLLGVRPNIRFSNG